MKVFIEIGEQEFRCECKYHQADPVEGEPEKIDVENISIVSHGTIDMTNFFKYISEHNISWEDVEKLCLYSFHSLE